MTPQLCKAARQSLGWTQEYLAVLSDVSRTTVSKYEGKRTARANKSTLNALCTAFDKAGVEFFGPPERPYPGLQIFDPTAFDRYMDMGVPAGDEALDKT